MILSILRRFRPLDIQDAANRWRIGPVSLLTVDLHPLWHLHRRSCVGLSSRFLSCSPRVNLTPCHWMWLFTEGAPVRIRKATALGLPRARQS